MAPTHRRREKVYTTHSSFLRRLAGLADSIHFAFFRIKLHEEASHSSPSRASFRLLVYKDRNSPPGKSPGCFDLIVSESRRNRFETSLFCFENSHFRIEDSEVLVQIVQAVGRLPGLSFVDFSFSDHRWSDSSLELGHEADCVIDRLLPVLSESLCSQGASSQLNRFRLHIDSFRRRLPAYEFLTLPGAIPSLESLEILVSLRGCENMIPALGDDAKRIALALRASKSLKSLSFTLHIRSWTEVSPALEIIAEPLMLSKIGDASGCARQKHLDGDLVLQELWLDLVLAGVPCIAHEAVKVMATVLDIAGLGFGVRKFSVSIQNIQLVMRIELGAFMELHVQSCGEAGAAVVEEALRLNRGPSVLSLGGVRPPLMRTILRPLTRDQNGLQANSCVSTLKLDNTNFVSTVELQEGRLEEVANMMKSNSTVEHLQVTGGFRTSDNALEYPQCSRDSPVVTQLQNRLRPGGNLRSFTFYGQEMAGGDVVKQQGNELEQTKVQCRRYLKPDRVMNVIVTMK